MVKNKFLIFKRSSTNLIIKTHIKDKFNNETKDVNYFKQNYNISDVFSRFEVICRNASKDSTNLDDKLFSWWYNYRLVYENYSIFIINFYQF